MQFTMSPTNPDLGVLNENKTIESEITGALNYSIISLTLFNRYFVSFFWNFFIIFHLFYSNISDIKTESGFYDGTERGDRADEESSPIDVRPSLDVLHSQSPLRVAPADGSVAVINSDNHSSVILIVKNCFFCLTKFFFYFYGESNVEVFI